MKKNTLLIELHYLPCIQYFCYLNSYQKILIDQNDIYSKQTYRNRCRINGANKIDDLIIPVKKISERPFLSCEVEIDYSQKWLNRHTRAIQSAYGKAPFYEYYESEILEVYNKKPILLFDLNLELLTKCLEILEVKVNLELVDKIDEEGKTRLFDAKNLISPKKTFYSDNSFKPINYFQVFGNNFVPNLSIIDLIFCEGPQAREYIESTSAFE